MIYSIRRIRSGRSGHECCQCEKYIFIGDEKIEMFGDFCMNGKPITIYAHESCLSENAREALWKKEHGKAKDEGQQLIVFGTLYLA